MKQNFGWKVSEKAPLWASRPLPERPAGWARLQLVLAGVCGTDVQMLQGYADFDGFLGHEFVARVLECDHPGWEGRRVVGEINVGCGVCPDARFCPHRRVLGIRGLDGCFAETFQLPLANLHFVDDLDTQSAVWCEPLAAALDVGLHLPPGVEVLILGDGRLGALIGLALKSSHPVTLLGRHPEKLERLRALGLATLDQTQREWPAVVEATGTAAGAALALQLCRPQGRVILKSTVAQSAGVDTNRLVIQAFHLIGSRCGRFEPALQALRSGRVDPRPLIDEVMDLADFPRAVARRGGFKVLLRGPESENSA